MLLLGLTAIAAASTALAQDAPLYVQYAEGSEWVTMYNRSQNCTPHDGTDSMPIAWHVRSLNQTFLVASVSDGDFPNVGPDILHLKHDCSRLVFNSTHDLDPASYANNQWLQSVRVFPNGTVFALIHNEFHGFEQPAEYCQLPREQWRGHCNLWSTGVGLSTDGGQTFHLADAPPKHRVFSFPYKYENNQSIYGYGAISAMMQGQDGAWYGLVYANPREEQPRGMCPFRSTDLGDPQAFRGWDGSGYTVRWIDPYVQDPGPDPSKFVCTPAPGTETWHSSHAQPRRLVLSEEEEYALRRGHPLEGEPGGSDVTSAQRAGLPFYVTSGDYDVTQGRVGFRFSTQPDFARAVTGWNASVQVLETGLDRTMGINGRLLYPALLDARSPGLGRDSYDVATNSSTYLLVNVGRNILRRRVVFTSTPPPAPPAPLPPNPSNCSSFRVTGAGEPGVDGLYLQTTRSADGVPIFQLSEDRQLYREAGVWRLAHIEVGVFYEPLDQGTPRPPPQNWRISATAASPAPESVVCADGDGA